MSTCRSCNVILNEEEESLLFSWGEPIELCLNCYNETDLQDLLDYFDEENHENY